MDSEKPGKKWIPNVQPCSDEKEKSRITNYFRNKVRQIVERFSENRSKTFVLFSELAEARGFTARIDRKRGLNIDQIVAGETPCFFAECRGKRGWSRTDRAKTVYIPGMFIERTDRLIEIDPQLVRNTFEFIVAHEDHEIELMITRETEKTVSESDVNKKVAEEIKDRDRTVRVFSDHLAYICLMLPVDARRQIVIQMPEDADEQLVSAIEKATHENIERLYPLLYKDDVQRYVQNHPTLKNIKGLLSQ
jgi:hypothetical protein